MVGGECEKDLCCRRPPYRFASLCRAGQTSHVMHPSQSGAGYGGQ
jgi:hypothetical protein